jgi:hypothetical protein
VKKFVSSGKAESSSLSQTIREKAKKTSEFRNNSEYQRIFGKVDAEVGGKPVKVVRTGK